MTVADPLADPLLVLYVLGSVLLVSGMSLVGLALIPVRRAVLGAVLLYLVSFAAGGLLGDAFLHLLPESVEEHGFTLGVSLAVLAGIVVAFVVEKFVHWHHHGLNEEHAEAHAHEHAHAAPFAWMILFGDFVHNIIDGMIIAAAYLVNVPLGIATTVAVVAHEIPQEVADFGVLLHAGFTKARALYYNFLSALGALVGAVVSFLLSARVEGFLDFLIPFAVGSFVYVAASDLIPELHKVKDRKKSVLQVAALLLGIAAMVGLLALEGDEHGHGDGGDDHGAGEGGGSGNGSSGSGNGTVTDEGSGDLPRGPGSDPHDHGDH